MPSIRSSQLSSSAVASGPSAIRASLVGGAKDLVVVDLQRLVQVLGAIGDGGELVDLGVDAAALLGDLGEVADAFAGDQDVAERLVVLRVDAGGEALGIVAARPLGEGLAEVDEHPGDAGVVELGGDRRVDRHLVLGELEGDPVAAPLFAHVAERVGGALLVELVDHDDLGEVEHVDLLQLRGGAELARHHVDRQVDEVDDLRVGLADAGGLDDHQVELGGAQVGDRVGEDGGGREVLPAGRHRAHVDLLVAEAVEADAVAEQGAAGAAAGRVDGEDGDAQVGQVLDEAREELVGDGRLAGAAGAGDADHRDAGAGDRPLLAQPVEVALGEDAVLERREHPGDVEVGVAAARGRGRLHLLGAGALDQVVDHPDEAEVHAVVGVVDALDPGALEVGDLVRRDRAAAAAEDADVGGVEFAEHLDRVLEVLGVAALVGADRDPVGVLLDRRADDVADAAVVAEVDDLGAGVLDQPAHHVDRGVVAVEQRSGGDEPQRQIVATARSSRGLLVTQR